MRAERTESTGRAERTEQSTEKTECRVQAEQEEQGVPREQGVHGKMPGTAWGSKVVGSMRITGFHIMLDQR